MADAWRRDAFLHVPHLIASADGDGKLSLVKIIDFGH
jgi:hypothetical protein